MSAIRPALLPVAVSLCLLLGGAGPGSATGGDGGFPDADIRAEARSAAALGDSLYDAADYTAAIEAYERATTLDPEDGESMFGLGISHHYLGRYSEAAAIYRKTIRFRKSRAYALYNLACAESLTGNLDDAFDALGKALDAGFPNTEAVLTDTDLDNLRGTPRFDRLLRTVFGPGYTGFDRSEPTPAEMREGIRILVDTIRERHPNPYRHASPAEWERRAADAIARADTLSAVGYYAEVRELAGLVADVHTSAYPRRGSSILNHSLPLRFWHFEDGLFVCAAAPDQAYLVGARVTAIHDIPIDEAWSTVVNMMSTENEFMSRYMAQIHLQFPDYLRALGLGDSDVEVTWTFDLANGSRQTLTLAATETDGYLGALGTSIGFDAPEGWIQGHEGAGPPPRWLARKNERYWMEVIEGSDAAFLQFNIPRNHGLPWREFLDRAFRTIHERDDVQRLVVDLRHNEGGWAYMAHELTHAIVSSPKINRPGHLYVLTSRITQSAGVTIAAKLDVETQAIFVGEGGGAHPNFYNGPLGNHAPNALPGTDIVFRVSTVLEQNSDPLDHRCFIAPDIPVGMRYADYAGGRDPVLEAALAAEPERAGFLLTDDGGRPGAVYLQWQRPTQTDAFRGDRYDR
ncbi:MAG: tetratricopeptide repeat protein [bacterium]|nr:tetratricopeptide repeat protein [bacterium]